MRSAPADPATDDPPRGSPALPSRGRLGIVATWVLIVPLLHVSSLVAPLVGLRLARPALGDPAVRLFLLLAVAFSLADLPTLFHDSKAVLRPPSADDRLARRWGLFTGLLLLAAFWTGLLERALAGGQGPAWPQACGALLMLAGTALRAAAVVTLGRAFITEWRVDADQPLIEHRIYARVRHPSETGNLAVLLGACLVLESRLALAFFLLDGPMTLLRIRGEDRRLADVHGSRFRRYARRVKRLVPGIY